MSDSNSSSTLIVAVIAIVVIVLLGLFALKMFPGANPAGGTSIDVDLPTGDGQ